MTITKGSRAQVYHGTADQTSGGLTKKDLKKTADGRIVSRAASKASKGNPWIKALNSARNELSKGTAAQKKAAKEMLVTPTLAKKARELMKKK